MESVKLTYDLPVPPAAAFYLFVGEIGQWWPSVHTHDPAHYRDVVIEGYVGGGVVTKLDNGEVVWGDVVEIDPPHHISWRQWWRQSPDFPSLITVRFSVIETGSRIHFEHGGWTRFNAHHRQRFVEWPVILSHYVSHTRAHARAPALARRGDPGVA